MQSPRTSLATPSTLFHLAGTPVQADASVPLNAIGVFSLCWILVVGRYPTRGFGVRIMLATLWTLLFWIVFGLHSIGHIISARAAGAPMDALVINAVHWITLYANDNVTPRMHIGRAAGGPLANLAGGLLGWLLRPLLPAGPFGRDLVEVFALFNAGLVAASLLPTPSFDGGSLLKWTTYEVTGNLRQASGVMRWAGIGTSFGLVGLAGAAFVVGKRLAGLVLAAFSLVAALESLRRG